MLQKVRRHVIAEYVSMTVAMAAINFRFFIKCTPSDTSLIQLTFERASLQHSTAIRIVWPHRLTAFERKTNTIFFINNKSEITNTIHVSVHLKNFYASKISLYIRILPASLISLEYMYCSHSAFLVTLCAKPFSLQTRKLLTPFSEQSVIVTWMARKVELRQFDVFGDLNGLIVPIFPLISNVFVSVTVCWVKMELVKDELGRRERREEEDEKRKN